MTITKQRFTFSELKDVEGEGLSIDADFDEAYTAYSKDRYARALDIIENALNRINTLHSIAHAAHSRLLELRANQIEEEFDEA